MTRGTSGVDTPIPHEALAALQADALLPVCKACGTQYSSAQTGDCSICLDPRQFVPAGGQEWTSLAELQDREISFVEDEEDRRIKTIRAEPSFAIGQTRKSPAPFLIETGDGSYIWDCAAPITLSSISHITSLKTPLKAIAISHPHFFTTSLTWARCFRVPLYLCEADKEWFQRTSDIRETDDVRWWTGEQIIGPRVKLIQCGGHFPGSSILYWDRLEEPAPTDSPTRPTPVSGIIFTADTLMVMPTQQKFTFIWSAPNMIPLEPEAVLRILRRIEGLAFAQATSTWPNRFIRHDAKRVLQDSVRAHLARCGWIAVGDELIPLKPS